MLRSLEKKKKKKTILFFSPEHGVVLLPGQFKPASKFAPSQAPPGAPWSLPKLPIGTGVPSSQSSQRPSTGILQGALCNLPWPYFVGLSLFPFSRLLGWT